MSILELVTSGDVIRPGLLGATVLAACHSAQVPPDAAGCWPVEGTSAAGSVELGTGDTAWAEMPDTLQLRMGSQNAGFLFVNSRILGLSPGDPSNFLNEGNPRTRIQGKLVDGTIVGGDCPSRIGYSPHGDGLDYWTAGQMLVFLPYTAEQTANNTNVIITIEVIDSARHYAKAQKTVFVTPRT
jgi:hypothetical protein